MLEKFWKRSIPVSWYIAAKATLFYLSAVSEMSPNGKWSFDEWQMMGIWEWWIIITYNHTDQEITCVNKNTDHNHTDGVQKPNVIPC